MSEQARGDLSQAEAREWTLRAAGQAALDWANAGGPADWALINVWREGLRAALAAQEDK